MTPEDRQERQLEIHGWPVHLTSYKLGDIYHCTLDNVSPGATIARTTGATRQEAEDKAVHNATEKLAATKRHVV